MRSISGFLSHCASEIVFRKAERETRSSFILIPHLQEDPFQRRGGLEKGEEREREGRLEMA